MKRLSLVKLAAALLTISVAIIHKEGNLFGMLGTILMFYYLPVELYKAARK